MYPRPPTVEEIHRGAAVVSRWQLANSWQLILLNVRRSGVVWCVLWLNDSSYSKSVRRDKIRNVLAGNTVVKLLAQYTSTVAELTVQLYREIVANFYKVQYKRNIKRGVVGWAHCCCVKFPP